MKIYLDTSAIVKYFHEEEGASQVIEIIDDPENTLWISELAVTEFLSAFHRKCRMGEINPEILQTVVPPFRAKYRAGISNPLVLCKQRKPKKSLWTLAGLLVSAHLMHFIC